MKKNEIPTSEDNEKHEQLKDIDEGLSVSHEITYISSHRQKQISIIPVMDLSAFEICSAYYKFE